jgi:hypothetical protein
MLGFAAFRPFAAMRHRSSITSISHAEQLERSAPELLATGHRGEEASERV